MPTHFSVDSNHDNAPYSNATTGHVTQNLLVYNDGAPAFDKRDVEDITEEDVVYHNIVKDGSGNYATDYLHLVDRQNFWCPIAFNVTQRAWYERKPEVYHNNPTDGWDALCLPFTIHKVSAQRGISDVLSHFYGGTAEEGASENANNAEPRGNTGHEYWLRGLIAVDGDNATFARPSVTAEAGVFYRSDFDHDSYEYPGNGYLNMLYNDADCEYDADEEHAFDVHNIYSHPRTFTDYPYLTYGMPYIVAFPGEQYREFDLSGQWTADISSSATVNTVPQTITYESENITVPVSVLKDVTAGGYTHRGAFINAGGSVYDLQESASHDGSSFGTVTAMVPFRSYLMATVSSARPMYIYINGDEDDEQGRGEEMLDERTHQLVAYSVNGNIIIESTYDTQLTIHTTAGQTVRAVTVQEGSNLYTGFAPGIYIINGKKLYVH